MSETKNQVDGDRKRWKAKRDAIRAADKKAMRVAARQWGALSRQQARKRA